MEGEVISWEGGTVGREEGRVREGDGEAGGRDQGVGERGGREVCRKGRMGGRER